MIRWKFQQCSDEPGVPVRMVGYQMRQQCGPFQVVCTMWQAMDGSDRFWAEMDVAPVPGTQSGRDTFVSITAMDVERLMGAPVEPT